MYIRFNIHELIPEELYIKIYLNIAGPTYSLFYASNCYVTNIFDRVDGTTNICQPFKVQCASYDTEQHEICANKAGLLIVAPPPPSKKMWCLRTYLLHFM